VDRRTGEMQEVELFITALGASSYTYAEASMTQQVADFIASHGRAFEYYGGVAGALVPDQLKSAVTDPGRYEPGIQRAYEEMARHYGTVVIPARPASPKDKAKVEAAVQVAQRWILARLPSRWPPSAAQTGRADFLHPAFTKMLSSESRWKESARQG